MKQRLFEKHKTAQTDLAKELGIKNVNALPFIEKIVVNAGLSELAKDKGFSQQAIADLSNITGQKPAIRKARVSIASFSLREGMPVGLKATLRKDRMFSFLDRIISIVLPRLRDFKGVSLTSFDSFGNYTIGFREQNIFPEIDTTKSPKVFGFEVTIVIRNSDVDKSKRFLTLLGMPFTKD